MLTLPCYSPSLQNLSRSSTPLFAEHIMSTRSRRAAAAASANATSTAPPKSTTAQGRPMAPIPKSMLSLFRSEVASLLSTPMLLPPHLAGMDGGKVEVLAAVERLSAGGMQQSVQLCRIAAEGAEEGDADEWEGETWVTRTEGGRAYFPMTGRVQKRSRAVAEEPEPEQEQEQEQEAQAEQNGDDEPMMEHDAAAAAAEETPRTRRGRRTTNNNTPRHSAAAAAADPPRRRAAAPAAPKKARRAPQPVTSDAEDGDHTETEDFATRGARASRRLAEALRKNGTELVWSDREGEGARRKEKGKGKKVARREDTQEQEEDVKPAVDDLESLCGKVGDFALGELLGRLRPQA